MIELFPPKTCCIYKTQMVLIVIGLALCCLGNQYSRIFRESWICTVLDLSCSVKLPCTELYCWQLDTTDPLISCNCFSSAERCWLEHCCTVAKSKVLNQLNWHRTYIHWHVQDLNYYRPLDKQLSYNSDDRNSYIVLSFILKVNLWCKGTCLLIKKISLLKQLFAFCLYFLTLQWIHNSTMIPD